jgi:hypothetical protein
MSKLVDAESGKPPAIISATVDIAIMMLTRVTQTAAIIFPHQQPRKILKQASLERERESAVRSCAETEKSCERVDGRFRRVVPSRGSTLRSFCPPT